jgi:hypothetical protein
MLWLWYLIIRMSGSHQSQGGVATILWCAAAPFYVSEKQQQGALLLLITSCIIVYVRYCTVFIARVAQCTYLLVVSTGVSSILLLEYM